MASLQSLLNEAVAWLLIRFPGGNPWLIAAGVAVAGWLASRVLARFGGWLLSAAAVAAAVVVAARVAGVGT